MTGKEVTVLYNALVEEGEFQDAPSVDEYEKWVDRQQFLLDRSDLSAVRKDSIRQRLRNAHKEPIPDGAEFYAWQNIEARARMERAIQGVDGVVDLQPPGQHEHKYVLGDDGRPTHVWYASYGSNLNRDRLMSYIEGGKPPGSTRTYLGCTDKSEPAEDIPVRVHGFRPHFAMNSGIWHGGIAFVDEADDNQAFLGRAYLITIEQYDQIVAQENGGTARKAEPVDLATVLAEGRDSTGMGAYQTNLHIGDHQGAPVVTFTSPFSVQDALSSSGVVKRAVGVIAASTNKPSPAYCRMIGSGLAETFGMSEVAQADYIRGFPGGSRWDRQDLVRTLRSSEPEIASPTTKPWTTTRAKGEFHPPVKTYLSREEQRAGVRRWATALSKANRSLATEERVLESMTGSGSHSKKDIDAQAKVVADALKSANEAHKKHGKAKDQEPQEWFGAAYTRTQRDWKKFADDLSHDIDRAMVKFNTAPDGSERAMTLAGRIQDLKEQHREAIRKSAPTKAPTKSGSGTSEPTPTTSGWVPSVRHPFTSSRVTRSAPTPEDEDSPHPGPGDIRTYSVD